MKKSYDNYLYDSSLSIEEKIKKLDEELQPTIDEITTSFSDVNVGYYIREFDLMVAKIIEQTKFLASSLQLEITESMAMHNLEVIISKLHQLRELGICISVDDFEKWLYNFTENKKEKKFQNKEIFY